MILLFMTRSSPDVGTGGSPVGEPPDCVQERSERERVSPSEIISLRQEQGWPLRKQDGVSNRSPAP